MELESHHGQDNSCSAQKYQNRQDNPIVIVDSERSKSKYAYGKISNFSLYGTTLLTDDADIRNFIGNVLKRKENLTTTRQ